MAKEISELIYQSRKTTPPQKVNPDDLEELLILSDGNSDCYSDEDLIEFPFQEGKCLQGLML